jgi:hypothetical protein
MGKAREAMMLNKYKHLKDCITLSNSLKGKLSSVASHPQANPFIKEWEGISEGMVQSVIVGVGISSLILLSSSSTLAVLVILKPSCPLPWYV